MAAVVTGEEVAAEHCLLGLLGVWPECSVGVWPAPHCLFDLLTAFLIGLLGVWS